VNLGSVSSMSTMACLQHLCPLSRATRRILVNGIKTFSQAAGEKSTLTYRHLGIIATDFFIAAGLLFLPSALWGKSEYGTLYKFSGGHDGAQPYGNVIFGAGGNLYGTTYSGGAYNGGTVFELKRESDGTWTESILHEFCSLSDCADGASPWAGLISDTKGNLYGTTQSGGAYDDGVVFELVPHSNGTWAENVLHSFSGPDGMWPLAGVVFDDKGSLYGTTQYGGANNRGVVFKLTHGAAGSWAESLLYSFCSRNSCRDGMFPTAAVIFDRLGALYGTTWVGGANCGDVGCGVVFQLTPHHDGSWGERILHQFNDSPDGAYPSASLTLDLQGNLYSTTAGGGSGSGTVFKLARDRNGTWQETILLVFDEQDGCCPNAGLTRNLAGTFYGATTGGGDFNCLISGCGVVFELTRNSKAEWKERILHDFSNDPGIFPYATPLLDQSGNVYGTTAGDNVKSHGSVYEIRR